MLYSKNNNVEFYKDIEDFLCRLRQSDRNNTVAVICAETIEDLIDVYLIKHFLYKAALIMILPDDEPATQAMGFMLRPIFIFNTNSNVCDIYTALQALTMSEKSNIIADCFPEQNWNQTGALVGTFCRAA